ncbi:isopenicillin N synthase family oxygenase [Marinomonas sp.]|nr:2-oxoglutarate and iron-dependent oxygenase domain-containing protein [Marinomonas sp.]MDB4837595.1 isopenicillin N synthase family oxygenase [Marinomonas sp.]
MSNSRSFQQIPIIDISMLYTKNHMEGQEKIVAAVKHAAEHVGFFYIKGHAIPSTTIQNLKHTAKHFFDIPMEDKMKSYIGKSSNHSGYVPEGEEQFYGAKVDKKEAFDVNFDAINTTFRRPMIGPNQWPDHPNFKNHVSAYYDQAFQLGKLMFKCFSLALNLPENTFDDKLECPPNQLRLIYYPYDSEAVDKGGIGAHTDYECFTLLLPTADGLEVLNGDGDWINAPFIENTLVVNIGDMMEIISNGRFQATSHRVRNIKEERYSFPMFCTCDYDTLIEPMVESTSLSNTKYEAVRCGDHLYAQTIQTFQYLKDRLSKGEISLPESSKDTSSFGQLRDALKGED